MNRLVCTLVFLFALACKTNTNSESVAASSSGAATVDANLEPVFSYKVDATSIQLEVRSTGCTQAASFFPNVSQGTIAEIRLVRTQRDLCKMAPHSVTVEYKREALGIAEGAHILILNPVGDSAKPAGGIQTGDLALVDRNGANFKLADVTKNRPTIVMVVQDRDAYSQTQIRRALTDESLNKLLTASGCLFVTIAARNGLAPWMETIKNLAPSDSAANSVLANSYALAEGALSQFEAWGEFVGTPSIYSLAADGTVLGKAVHAFDVEQLEGLCGAAE